MPTVMLDASALAQLIQIALQLVQQVEAIRANAPQVWTQVSQDYADAVKSWEAASAKIVPEQVQTHLELGQVQETAITAPTVAEALTGLPLSPTPTHYNDARQSGVNNSSSEATSG